MPTLLHALFFIALIGPIFGLLNPRWILRTSAQPSRSKTARLMITAALIVSGVAQLATPSTAIADTELPISGSWQCGSPDHPGGGEEMWTFSGEQFFITGGTRVYGTYSMRGNVIYMQGNVVLPDGNVANLAYSATITALNDRTMEFTVHFPRSQRMEVCSR